MKRQTPVELPEGYVDFFINLENWQNKQQIKLAKSCRFDTYDIKQLLASGNRPLIELKGITVDPDIFKAVLFDFIVFMKENRPDTLTSMEKLELKLNQFDFRQIIAQLIGPGTERFLAEQAAEIELSPDLLLFVFDHAFRPFLRVFAALYQEALVNDDSPFWPFPNICPVCGSKSHFSRLRSADGRRFMFCDRCFSEWETRFLQCVHCGNDDPRTISYYSVENDDAYQVYLCDKCQGYLKTYDERPKKELTDLFIANIETVYLDLLAQEKGYSNHE